MNTSKKTVIFWFRQDLRISDNPGLLEAAQKGEVLPIYIWSESVKDPDSKIGEASKWWLHYSLEELNRNLDNKLNFYLGDPKDIIIKLLRENNVTDIYWNRCYEPWRIIQDSEIKRVLTEEKITVKSFAANLLWEPFTVLKNDKTPYKVYTPYYHKGCINAPEPRASFGKPKSLKLIKDNYSLKLEDLQLLNRNNWHKKFENLWEIGEKAAEKKLNKFLKNAISNYKNNRNYPSLNSVSQLSPHLHFGEISPNQIRDAVYAKTEYLSEGVQCFLSEIGWREFSYYLLYYFPTLSHKNFQAKFDKFPWVNVNTKNNKKLLKAWQIGQTGYPFVDAGMRELWQTGYMHNRVRMVVASFLVKNLLIHWHHGRDWFWDCLIDGDLASNSASWQWVAGSGADAAPYFRIFNPTTQGEKFDADGFYTRKYLPELSKLPSKYLFEPWKAPETVLQEAGIVLGTTYPYPIIDLQQSREVALASYQAIK